MDRINNSHQKAPLINEESSSSILLSNLLLDNFGEVVLTHNSDGLSWKSIDFIVNDHETCLGIKVGSNRVSAIRFSDIYAAEFLNWGLMRESSLTNPGVCFQSPCPELYRFSVHFVQRSKSQPSIWIPTVYTFGHINSKTCQMWVDRINTCLNVESDRPKSLLVFVHPRSGKENGCKAWKTVAPIFSHAKVKTKEIVTERPGHAFDVMANITNRELNSYDGVVAVGGDGFFSEILNGLLLTRHKASYPPRPTDSEEPVETKGTQDISSEGPVQCEDVTPLLNDKALVTNLRTDDESCYTEQDSEFSLPNKRFRIGIIPAGSTDAIVICTTGARDPITSALQIVLGKKVSIDIAQVVRWKITPTSKDEPYVRYAASFSGYGFYGDVITESEKYRWMGPKRYDYAGTKVFLRHSLYEAEVAYLETEPENPSSSEGSRVGRKKGLRALPCRANCNVCNTTIETSPEIPKWKRTRGNFISIGAAIISCRNEKAPDGLVAEAHLSDGFLHLILIKDCPRAYYLWHLTQLTRKGGHPLDFEFVEHIKTRAFTFTSFGKESVWNVDGEIVEAHQLSAQVFRGLVTLFATGPEV